MANNKFRYSRAVGLSYEEGAFAPAVTVKGETFQADDIVKIAMRCDIPVVHDPDLSRTMSELEVDSEIPEELFHAVAVLLDNIEKNLQKKHTKKV